MPRKDTVFAPGVSSSSLTDLAFDVEDDMPVSLQLDSMHEKRRPWFLKSACKFLQFQGAEYIRILFQT